MAFLFHPSVFELGHCLIAVLHCQIGQIFTKLQIRFDTCWRAKSGTLFIEHAPMNLEFHPVFGIIYSTVLSCSGHVFSLPSKT